MLTREYGDIVFQCDECCKMLNPCTDEFSEALRELKIKGWRVRKIGDDWTHICARCWNKR